MFGIAELEDEGWMLRSEVAFRTLDEAKTVAHAWRRGPVGVAEIRGHRLVWRSDGGELSSPCLGIKLPSTFPHPSG
jgi:hypothetical protein